MNLDLPYRTRKNGTLYGHIFVSPRPKTEWYQLLEDSETVHLTMPLTKYYIPDLIKVKLLGNSSFVDMSTVKPVTHVKKVIPFLMLADPVTFIRTELPGDIYKYMR